MTNVKSRALTVSQSLIGRLMMNLLFLGMANPKLWLLCSLASLAYLGAFMGALIDS